MRVLHVMAGAKEGGAENIMLESVLALAGAGIPQAVVTRADNEFRIEKFKAAGIEVTTADFNRLWPFPTQSAIARVYREFRPDVAEYWMGRAGQFAPKTHRARSIAWYGGYYKLARFLNCEWHVGLTKDILRHIREQGVAENRSAIIHTYADFEGAAPVDRASLTTPKDAPVALALARLHVKKGLDTLLDATAKVPGLWIPIYSHAARTEETVVRSINADLRRNARAGIRNDNRIVRISDGLISEAEGVHPAA